MNVKKSVYYCCPVQGNRVNIKNCIYTVDFLKKKLNCDVLTDYIVTDNANGCFAKRLGVDEIDKYIIREKSVERLYKAEYLIADISAGSTGVGMEIELARHRHLVIGGEPMMKLLIYYRPLKKYATWMATGIKCRGFDNMYIQSYRSKYDLKKILRWFVGK